jgi:hypothetical protein
VQKAKQQSVFFRPASTALLLPICLAIYASTQLLSKIRQTKTAECLPPGSHREFGCRSATILVTDSDDPALQRELRLRVGLSKIVTVILVPFFNGRE